jgi:hypothetical protein
MKSNGQLAYENDLAVTPTYHDGTPRKTWDELPLYARQSWERNPTPRTQGAATDQLHHVEYYAPIANEGGEGLWRGERDALSHAERILAQYPDAEITIQQPAHGLLVPAYN